ncbi:TIM-barrel domain-containing protein [Rhizosphaericola mali]|uniref:DUF5110 domain-containing protein n=1 Tax=Rhizosphaericola mali TaxID=2545455 RepID=A0A5P2GAR2_9BACT|nr:TIM-barrel domain-containing protein [Rhizosphaericola mali]QES88641.1 DUF5110 domain-containing protein [Rhizosphaericola mali]
MDKQKCYLDFYGDNIFRMYEDTSGVAMHDPVANPEAHILVNNPRVSINSLEVYNTVDSVFIDTKKIHIAIHRKNGLLTIVDKQNGKHVLTFLKPVQFEKNKVILSLHSSPTEYYYGGGVQNGRFSHKGKMIAIENQNSWTDGGVASPTPFYWSTNGYGILFYTFQPGQYDFGSKNYSEVILSHKTNYLDVFFMVDPTPKLLLKDFYQLTGNPVLLPKFGFYEGHLNAYNRDYWKENKDGIEFENGKKYSESQKDNGGIKESLNGEKNNYLFSARAVIDRYKYHDVPLGWILPNDGYGAGYGQTSTLDSNIANLKSFGQYARKNGVQIGLWTQSDLHPKPGISALLQRDIIKEVQDAGVRVLKTDVAWVGAGYSFGLNGVSDVGNIIPKYGNNSRPFIISLDGWAGTQRYATIWSGDQTGGQWEYIRFHIPTYIGSGLSGQPNITSDMDGIFGGKNSIVNIRDFQWKTFTPMQLNMDGWGSNEKYPFALGEPAASINRNYLKWKSELLPYSYSVAHNATSGEPIIRAMMLIETNKYTLGKSTQYQYLYGPYFLIAPIYQATNSDNDGNDLRNNIYLPKGEWVDYFTGTIYKGDRIINNYNAPIWKLPVFVKKGAIVPLNNANNNVTQINTSERTIEFYPSGHSSFTLYDDDGATEAYNSGKYSQSKISSNVLGKKLTISIAPTMGDFDKMEITKSTNLKINISQKPTSILAIIGNKKVKLKEVFTQEDWENNDNVYFFNEHLNWNQFATKDSLFTKIKIQRNPQLWVRLGKTNTLKNKVDVTINGFKFESSTLELKHNGALKSVQNFAVVDSNATAYSLKPTWNLQSNADYYEIKFDSMLYSTIYQNNLIFEDLVPDSNYKFEIRAVNKSGYSTWKKITAKTQKNPLEFAIHNISAVNNVPDQEGNEIDKLFDFDENDMWHTEWGKKGIPLTIVADLKTMNTLAKLEYLPRSRGNGIITEGKIYYSLDKKEWTLGGDIHWKKDGTTKTFEFKNHPTARFVKLVVTQGVGDFGSGRELYIFKVPGSESYLPGDINNDHLIDENDLTSYTNYTGLRKGDGDFDGYISNGDLNKNNLIDAYDISNVATQLKGGIDKDSLTDSVHGKIELEPTTLSFKEGDIVKLKVTGNDLYNVNAFSFALPYDPALLEYVGIHSNNISTMENMTYDRLHSNAEKVLYPTFVNIGLKPTLNGTSSLFEIEFKAKKDGTIDLKMKDGILVNRALDSEVF